MPPHDSADTVIRVPLNSKKYPGLFAVVDSEDADLVSQYRWHIQSGKRRNSPPVLYAWAHDYSNGRSHQDRKIVQMHRIILGLSPNDPDVDHVDGDGLNCRRQNLRLCTDSQNQANRFRPSRVGAYSQFRGVTWSKKSKRWQAAIKVMGKNHHLGQFISEVDAALAYNAAALKHFGEFASLNVVDREVAA